METQTTVDAGGAAKQEMAKKKLSMLPRIPNARERVRVWNNSRRNCSDSIWI
jgi:hypothetical protein